MSDTFIMPFGKHRGEELSDIPVSYLDWLIGQTFMEEKQDLLKTILAHLETRPEWSQMGDD